MNKFLLYVIVSFFFFYSTINFAQSRFSHEVGGYFGVASLQTDFRGATICRAVDRNTLVHDRQAEGRDGIRTIRQRKIL